MAKKKSTIKVWCVKCGKQLERDATKVKPFWVCTNVYCEKNQRAGGVLIGTVHVYGKRGK